LSCGVAGFGVAVAPGPVGVLVAPGVLVGPGVAVVVAVAVVAGVTVGVGVVVAVAVCAAAAGTSSDAARPAPIAALVSLESVSFIDGIPPMLLAEPRM
jgi:hypothetical protein